MTRITQAFVLGAGLGTRLRPLTDDLPKPLVPVFQKPLITFALDHLIALGVSRFIINTHKAPDKFSSIAGYRTNDIAFVNEPVLLETGGGIKNIERQLGGEPFITYSGDILTDVDLGPLVDEHLQRGNDVTLGLRKTGLAAAIALRDGRVVDISNRYGQPGEYDFANIAIWNPAVFQRIPPQTKISFIPVVGDWIGHSGRIGGVVLGEGRWFNIGSRTEYLEVHRTILREHWKPGYVVDPDWPRQVAAGASVDPAARISGCSVVAEDCKVGPQAVLEDTILWAGAQIASRAHLSNCIVRSRCLVEGTHRDTDL